MSRNKLAEGIYVIMPVKVLKSVVDVIDEIRAEDLKIKHKNVFRSTVIREALNDYTNSWLANKLQKKEA